MSKLIKVAIDISPVKTGHKVRGVGMYTQRLEEALEDIRISGYQDIRIDPFDFKTGNWKLKTGNYDVVHYPYFDLFFLTLPLRKMAKTVVTIHDVIPLIFPEHYPPGIKGKIKFLIQKFSLRGVSAVITDSENSKKDIFKYLNYPKDKIHVIYLAPGEAFEKLATDNWQLATRRKYSLPDQFVLYVGDVNWNKNILGLVKACKKIQVPLVIVGKQAVQEDFDRSHPENQDLVWLQEHVQSSTIDHQSLIILTGFVPEEDLVKIYNLATVYCQPSFYEGFGLPVLEAMACGCPVVAAKTSSLPEVCGQAAILIDPKDYNEIAKGIQEVIENKEIRDKLIKKGIERAKKFSWKQAALETMGVYEKVVKE
jgi:glycosyltransferase involved in cell wall biosynthesis